MFEGFVVLWANENGVPLLLPEDYQREDFRESPCIDYGKFIEKSPRFVFRPLDQNQLSACLQFLSQQQIPFKVRGAGHSSGGQVLTDRGAVLDLRNLNRIVHDDPGGEQITVEGGCWWLGALQHLHPQQRRPLVLTDNSRTTVAGTLSVGGFGDTTHLYGLQIQTVTQLKLMMLNGETHVVKRGDQLFRYVLSGRGQLGVIAEATVKTMRRPAQIAARLLKWDTLDHFAEDAMQVMQHRFYEFFRTKFYWQEAAQPYPVKAVAGNFVTTIPNSDPALEHLRPNQTTSFEQIDIFKHAIYDPSERWGHCSPSLEIVLPLPSGLQTWDLLRMEIIRSGIANYIPRGSSIMVMKADRQNFPLAPFPNAEFCFIIAIRPAMTLEEVSQHLPELHHLADIALDAGAKLYLMSIEVSRPDFLQLQFGNLLSEFRVLKQQMDPLNLLNPGLL